MNKKELAKRLKRMGKDYLSALEHKKETLISRKDERSLYLEECLYTRELEELAEAKKKISVSIVKYWMTTFDYWRNHSVSMYLLEAMAFEKDEIELKDFISEYSKDVLRQEQITDLWFCKYHYEAIEEIYLLESIDKFDSEEFLKFRLFLTEKNISDEEIDESVMRSFLTSDQMTALHLEITDQYCKLIDLAVARLGEPRAHVEQNQYLEISKKAIRILFQCCAEHSDSQMAIATDLLGDLLRE
jgi:hypothetical protein